MKDYFDSLVVPKDVDVHVGGRTPSINVTSQNLHLKIARFVGHEEVVGADDAVC